MSDRPDDMDDEPELDALHALYARMIGRLGQAVIELTLDVRGLRTLLVEAAVVTEDQLRSHLAAYRAAHELEVRELFIDAMGRPDDEDEDDEDDEDDER